MITNAKELQVSNIVSRLVSFPGPRGLKILGFLDEGEAAAWNGRFVILAPRYGETKKNNLQLSYFLVANGFRVLRFDQTNHIGESDGSMDQFTLQGVAEDIVHAVDYISETYAPEELILVTVSLSSRCGYRACAIDQRISRFVSLVGMVDMDHTLKAIYNRDIFGEIVAGKLKGGIDILGFNIDSIHFHDSLVASGMIDFSGTLEDSKKIKIPVLHLYAEYDMWVDRGAVETLIENCPNGRFQLISGVGHEINENKEAAKFGFNQVLEFCLAGCETAGRKTATAHKSVLFKQNKIERQRLQEIVKFTENEDAFWGSYLGKFGIIEQADYYVDYFQKMAELLGGLNSNDILIDAGCGNGFYGISIIRSILLLSKGGLHPQPIHYVAVDLTADGLGRSYSRHVEELVDLQKEIFAKSAGVNFSYMKQDFDLISPAKGQHFPLQSESANKICSSLVLSYLKEPLDMVKEFYRLLKPKGVAVISSMKPGCDMTVLYHEAVSKNQSEAFEAEAKVLLSAAGQIKLKNETGIYKFFSIEELTELALGAGFTQISSFVSFGGQANIIRVVK